MTDELEQRLRAADPAPPTVPVDPARSSRAQTLVEHIMNDTLISIDTPPAAGPRRWTLIAAAAAVVLAVAVGGAVALSGDDDPAAPPLALVTEPDNILQSCIELTVDTLRDLDAEHVFKGTVTSVDGDVATLDVEKWYRGGDTETVTVTGASGDEQTLLGGVALEQGGSYLVSAHGGTVLSCGASGVATPELEALFEGAFSS